MYLMNTDDMTLEELYREAGRVEAELEIRFQFERETNARPE
jgi:hypothetical protein